MAVQQKATAKRGKSADRTMVLRLVFQLMPGCLAAWLPGCLAA